jgi:glycosyltransferase involved in cell wall biosynthesis|tara:strand:+ start:282 stop:1376 length:1095 start_codon:yes stop_codon:yes gene_type:complete
MKILVFTSRYTAGRDIIDEDFGRQVRIFEQLVKLGHSIDFFCADYLKLENKDVKLHGINVFIRPFKPAKILDLISKFKKTIEKNNYDWIVATSDPLWGVFGYFLAKKFKIKFMYDVQDNYLLYKSYKIPFFGIFERYVTRNSDLVMCASNNLTDKVKKIRRKKIVTISNGVDTKIFKPLSKTISRKKLNLPSNAKIISYIGTVQRLQGVDILMDTFEELRKEMKDAKLLIVGKIGTFAKENFDFDKEGIIYLGSLPHKKVIYAINASDVIVMPYPNNTFTEFMFAPYKLMEFMACNKPLIITDAGEMKKHIKNKKMIAKAGDVKDLKEKIKYALKLKKMNLRKKAMEFDWKNLASKLNKTLEDI